MNAPEKIYVYLSDRAGEDFDNEWGIMPLGEDSIEYTRTDAFIQKACSWLENNLQGIVGGSIYMEDFRKYMKGE